MSVVNNKQFKCQECLALGRDFFFFSLLKFYQSVRINHENSDNISSKETKIRVFPWLPLLAEKGGGKKISM